MLSNKKRDVKKTALKPNRNNEPLQLRREKVDPRDHNNKLTTNMVILTTAPYLNPNHYLTPRQSHRKLQHARFTELREKLVDQLIKPHQDLNKVPHRLPLVRQVQPEQHPLAVVHLHPRG